MNLNNGNETKSDIFSRDIFKSDVIYFLIKKYQSISITFKIKIYSFVTKVNPNNGNETKSWDILKSDAIYFIFKKY